ncbi:MAG: hypothetical protein ABIT71_21785 [Vicinamibacteraceae bacterium]
MARPALSVIEPRPTLPSGAVPTFSTLVERIRAEYIEQPGLRLTEAQASRLWRLDEPTTRHALHELTGVSFLRRTDDGRYARPSTR